MKVAITGASGLVGRPLQAELAERGHEVVAVPRKHSEGLSWDAKTGFSPQDGLSGFDALINLSGEPIAKRFTEDHKRRVISSRVGAGAAALDGLKHASPRPKVLLNASAIGFYGSQGLAPVDETTGTGPGFLGETTRLWEESVASAPELDVRLVYLRIGVVLTLEGGALAKMLPAFKAGVGGRLGGGDQGMSWIHIDDLIAAIVFCLENEAVEGPVNLTAPKPVPNAEFTKELGKALRRPTIFPVPGFGLKAIFGEMAQPLLLDGAYVLPKVLEEHGFKFEYDTIDVALANLLA